MHIDSLDTIDNQIINLLLEDARMGYSEIGERVGLSRTAVKTRIAALERQGIIKGYKAIIDPQAAPETMTFVTNIETKPDSFEECKRIFAESPETVTIVHTTGSNCHLVAICLAPDVKTMRNFVNKIYKEVPGIISINANSVLDVIKGSIIPEK
jgi:DNA-binding Lrp family transcriptional regulator